MSLASPENPRFRGQHTGSLSFGHKHIGNGDSNYYTKYKDFKPPSWGSLTEGLAVEICNRA